MFHKDRQENAGNACSYRAAVFDDAVPTILADIAIELQRAADNLGRGLHPESAAELADLVRVMNSYYSNLIEGHNTRPRDIERALAGAEIDPERRPLWGGKFIEP